jgi:uncharacterized protein
MVAAMDTLEEIKTELRRLKPEIESRYPIRLVSIFGSFVRGEQTADSDVDVLAEAGVGKLSLFDIIGVEQLLEKKLRRRVDLVMIDGIRERIKNRVLSEAIPL